MDNKDLIIITLVIALIYLYYQNQNQKSLPAERVFVGTDNTLLNLLNVNSLEELKTKLGEKTLNELLEENEDYETEVDTLTRTKNSLEQDLSVQSTAFQNRLREKDREVKKLKEDLGSEKQQHKGSLGRISKLTEQITNLEKEKQELSRTKSPIPGEFPQEDLTKEHQAQLRKIYSLFDLRANGMKEIDFNQLMNMLQEVKKKVDKK